MIKTFLYSNFNFIKISQKLTHQISISFRHVMYTTNRDGLLPDQTKWLTLKIIIKPVKMQRRIAHKISSNFHFQTIVQRTMHGLMHSYTCYVRNKYKIICMDIIFCVFRTTSANVLLVAYTTCGLTCILHKRKLFILT